ncbi:MAG: hypothetical protein NTY98_00915 [Verrucomicrobia bacterium]|nr:hypothetical protein [Verrucomicrobiota bacterium]
MSDDTSRSSNSTAIMALMIALPLFYGFSIGPAIYFTEKFHPSASIEKPLKAFYAPVLWLHANTFLKQPLESYERFWMKMARGR